MKISVFLSLGFRVHHVVCHKRGMTKSSYVQFWQLSKTVMSLRISFTTVRVISVSKFRSLGPRTTHHSTNDMQSPHVI